MRARSFAMKTTLAVAFFFSPRVRRWLRLGVTSSRCLAIPIPPATPIEIFAELLLLGFTGWPSSLKAEQVASARCASFPGRRSALRKISSRSPSSSPRFETVQAERGQVIGYIH